MHLLFISALFTPAKVRVLPPFDRGKSLELRELNRVVADELINEADGTSLCVQTHFDLAERPCSFSMDS